MTSILLPPFPMHSGPASSSSSTSSSSSLSDKAILSPATAAKRRIRFAPLPDPRRSVVITDEGYELPIQDDTHFPAAASLAVLAACANGNFPPQGATLVESEPPSQPSSQQPEESLSSSSNSYLSTSSLPSSTTSTPRTATPSDLDNKYSSPPSSVGSSPVAQNAALPGPKQPTPPNPLQPAKSNTQPPPSAFNNKPRTGMSLLRPFKRSSAPSSSSGSSSYSLTPTPSIDAAASTTSSNTVRRPSTAEGILTRGTINLFRTSSRESSKSNQENNSSSGWGLSRWTSSESGLLSGSSPLARTQSTQSYKSKSKASKLKPSISLFSSSSSSSLDSKSPSISSSKSQPPPRSRHKGARMLNGRVYGAPKRPAGNPFANARDEEPEFVEWGYGGMGSVKGAKSAGVSGGNPGGVNWERLHGGAAKVVDKMKAEEDLDDGSGMGWVKKRREERERKAREAKEKEEKEKEEQEKAAAETSESTMSTPTPTRTSTMDTIPIAAADMADSSEKPDEIHVAEPESINEEPTAPEAETEAEPDHPSHSAVPTPNASFLNAAAMLGGMTPVHTPAAQTPPVLAHRKEQENAHVLQAVNVPMYPRRHSHKRSISRSSAMDEVVEDEVVVEDEEAAPAAVPLPSSPAVVTPISSPILPPAPVPSTIARPRADSNSSSGTSSESESEDEHDDEDEDEEEDEEEEKKRRTAYCAGVEKVSRHKE